MAREALAAFSGSPAAQVAERSAVLRARRALIEAELDPGTDPEAVVATLTDAIAAAELAECRELAGRGRLLLGDSLSGRDPGRAMGEYHRALAHLEQVVGEGLPKKADPPTPERSGPVRALRRAARPWRPPRPHRRRPWRPRGGHPGRSPSQPQPSPSARRQPPSPGQPP